jgi:hypothetical protein
MKNHILIFDVESTSLYGEGFAVGAIVANAKGEILETFERRAIEYPEPCKFVKDEVIPHLSEMPKCANTKELRDLFYNFYMSHKETCLVFSDCNYPVETNFLSSVVNDDMEYRQWDMPYPLYDVANFVDIEIDRAEMYVGKALRKHHPLDDCKASFQALTRSNFREFIKI